MKKLSVLMAGLTCLTVGGVYATWTYAQNADVDRQTTAVGVAMSGIADSGAYGTYEIILEQEKGLITVNPTAVDNHNAVLAYNGDITIKFTPSPSASQDVKTQGVATVYKFYTVVGASNDQAAWVYNDPNTVGDDSKQIFNVVTTPVTIEGVTATGEANKWTKDGDAFVYVITQEMLKQTITLANNFFLDNKTEYEAFEDALETGSIICYVNDSATEVNN